MISEKNQLYIVAAIVAAIALYIFARGWSGAAKDVAGAVVSVGTGAVAGTAESIGSTIGVPLTDADKCDIAIAGGHTFDASLFCPASRFLTYLESGK